MKKIVVAVLFVGVLLSPIATQAYALLPFNYTTPAEPTTMLLLGFALLGLAGIGRRLSDSKLSTSTENIRLPCQV